MTWDDHGGDVFDPVNAAHIAAFDPPTVLALIAKLREAEAVISEAREELRAASIPPGMTEAMFNRVLMVLADMTLATYKHTNQEGGNDGT